MKAEDGLVPYKIVGSYGSDGRLANPNLFRCNAPYNGDTGRPKNRWRGQF
jgi:hypothetical protein